MNSNDLSTQLWQKLETVLGRSVPFSRGRSDRLLELGEDPMDTWRKSPENPGRDDWSICADPPSSVIDAFGEWDFKFRMLANEIASDAGISV